ncbi:MAG: UDP-N-acetylmuramate dehydrogenase [Pseudomonadota bacterium]
MTDRGISADLRRELEAALGDQVRFDEPMSRHTSWRVGGPADVLVQPTSENALATFLALWPEEAPVHWIGLGSNLLVRDGGIRGAVITSKKLPHDLNRLDDTRVSASVGLPCTALARQLLRWNLGPSEFFAGIPGSLGGALTMNAGAHGHETWEVVESVRLVTRKGETIVRAADTFEVAYRSVTGHDSSWFIGATLSFDADYVPSRERMQALQDKRRTTQPLGLPSCGSVFRNPPGDHAARLIEAAGLKGRRIGGAEVSPKHANFIINAEAASAADIEQLIETVAGEVKSQHGISLRHEVRFLGDGR